MVQKKHYLIIVLALSLNFSLSLKSASIFSAHEQISTNNVVIDGNISPGEYENSLFMNNLNTYKFSYTVDGDQIFIGIEAKGRGWVAMGITPDDPALHRHNKADIIMGSYSTTTGMTKSDDKYGDNKFDIKVDTFNGGSYDILESKAWQNSSWTIFEFSRKLVTGDIRDNNIQVGVGQTIMWAYHLSVDYFGEHHSYKGFKYVIFYEDTFIPPIISDPSPSNDSTFRVKIDGNIQPNEYPFSLYLDSLYQYKLHYGIVNNTAYFGLEVQTLGWVALGFQPNNPITNKHLGADIVLGAYDSTTNKTVYRDDFGDTSTSHHPDTTLGGTNDIINASANENTTTTVLEFSRPLKTGDTFDNNIHTNTPFYLIWSYHISLDDMTTMHSAKGYKLVTFYNFNSSNNSSIKIPALPFAPEGLNGSYNNNNHEILLNWSPPPFDGNSAITRFNLYRRLYNESNNVFIGTNTTIFGFIDTNITPNIAYYYVVRAENSVGESPNSNEVWINTFVLDVSTGLNSNTSQPDKNENATGNQSLSEYAENNPSIPIGLSWALFIPVIYGGLLVGLVTIVKLKNKSRSP